MPGLYIKNARQPRSWTAFAIFTLAATSMLSRPAEAITWPLNPTSIKSAVADGEKMTQAQVVSDPEWSVDPETSGAERLLVETPYLSILFAAARAHERYDDATKASKKAATEAKADPTITFLVQVSSEDISSNKSPAFVIKQHDKIIHASKSDAGDPDVVEGGSFQRSLTGAFLISKIDLKSPFELIVAGLDDRGRTELRYQVDPSKIR